MSHVSFPKPAARPPAASARPARPSMKPAQGPSLLHTRPSHTPAAAPVPLAEDDLFARLGLESRLVRTVRALGYSRPTPIQQQAIPVLMQGRDLMASAATGSGKTAAFLLPLLHRLMGRPRGGTRALVLTPTRELAAQILDHFNLLSAGTGLRAAAVYGGVAMSPQVQAFKSGVDLLVATPGRLLDHFQYPYARLDRLDSLILDEADRMLDMGFLPDVRRILDHLPRERQTLLFSATLPGPIVELAGRMLRDPQTIHVEPKPTPARGISHRAFVVRAELKTRLLLELIRQESPQRALAFTRTRHRANRLADFLEARGVSCARIHGSRSQAQRTAALDGFKAGRHQVLVATDIAARGIDVTALDLVVNFDIPVQPEDYIHRVGRTARAEATGEACTLVAPDEENALRVLERGIGQRIPRASLEGFDYNLPVEGRFEVPAAERIAAHRARMAESRERARAKAERHAPSPARPSSIPGRPPARTNGPRSGYTPGGSGSKNRR